MVNATILTERIENAQQVGALIADFFADCYTSALDATCNYFQAAQLFSGRYGARFS